VGTHTQAARGPEEAEQAPQGVAELVEAVDQPADHPVRDREGLRRHERPGGEANAARGRGLGLTKLDELGQGMRGVGLGCRGFNTERGL
jgi:hypothetical protein